MLPTDNIRKQQHWGARRASLSVLKMAAKGIEQHHAPLPTVSKCGADLVLTMSQTNLGTLERVQKEAMIVILVTTKDTPTETMRFTLELLLRQTRHKVEQVKAFTVEDPCNTSWSRERHNWMQTGTGQVLDGSSRGLSTATMPADRAQANQLVVIKGTQSDPVSLWDAPARRRGKGRVKNGQRAKWIQRSNVIVI